MRQVSTTSLPPPPHYGVIGNGLMATHIKAYLTLCHLEHLCWSRASLAPLKQTLVQSDIILLAISDKAIIPFLQVHQAELSAKVCVHFSGSIHTPNAYGFHPLMTFSQQPYSLKQYQSILFAKDTDAPCLQKIFPTFKNKTITVSAKNKAYYHALCSIANNFSTLLWQTFFSSMGQEFGAQKEDLTPFLQQTLVNLATDHQNALTGPLARNDQQTVLQHIDTLAKNNPALAKLYQSFVHYYQELNHPPHLKRETRS